MLPTRFRIIWLNGFRENLDHDTFSNCNYSLKSMLVDMDAAMLFFKYEVAYVLAKIINI
jgi:hypothetical protein